MIARRDHVIHLHGAVRAVPEDAERLHLMAGGECLEADVHSVVRMSGILRRLEQIGPVAIDQNNVGANALDRPVEGNRFVRPRRVGVRRGRSQVRYENWRSPSQ